MDELTDFYVHEVTVEPYLGGAGSGPVYGPPEPVGCFVEDRRRLVRNAAGDEVVSETTLYCPPSEAGKFPAGSRVTRDGRAATVLTVGRHTSGPLGLPDHTQVTLT